MMPWEVDIIQVGTTIYVDGEPFTAVGARWRGVGTEKCPPYVGMVGHEDGPQDGPSLPLLEDHDEGSLHGTPIWWLSHCRVMWDAAPLQGGHPAQVHART